jgi:hypothetical protein
LLVAFDMLSEAALIHSADWSEFYLQPAAIAQGLGGSGKVQIGVSWVKDGVRDN